MPPGPFWNVDRCFFGHCFGWLRFVDPTASVIPQLQ
jgi:hypothetical protein